MSYSENDQTWLAEDLVFNSTDGLYTLAQAVDLPDSVVMLSSGECRESYGDHAYCDAVGSSDGAIDYRRLGQAIDSVAAATGTSQYRGICPEGWHLPWGDEWSNLLEWINENLRYPEELADSCIQGRVIVTFIINEDGTVSDGKVVRSLHPLLDAEALRLVSIMPRWSPYKLNGKAQKNRYTMPVIFKLQ